MPGLHFSGPVGLRLNAIWTISRISVAVLVRHSFRRRMAPDWDMRFEIGIRFWRHQFTRAMTAKDMTRGRQILASMQTETDDVYEVKTETCHMTKGHWYRPSLRKTDAVILFFHGGGYAFHGDMSRRFAAMLAHHSGAELFAPDYRLTPEHTHPAQAEDALAAYRHMLKTVPPEKLIVMGDSAGGHMALMLLLAAQTEGLPQPSLCIGLCPWTDIGARGDSLKENDRFDLVQGWMALQFGQWLDPENLFGRNALSPISHTFQGLAPIYLQAGGREVLRDMIVDFAKEQEQNGADVMLDLWPDMPHDFQAFDSEARSAQQALDRIATAINSIGKGNHPPLSPAAVTRVAAGRFVA